MKNLKIINDYKKFDDFRDFINDSTSKYATNNAFVIKHKKGKEVNYEYISYSQMGEDIKAIGTALIHRGLAEKRVAVIGRNSYPWVCIYLATICAGNVIVPLDKLLPEEEAESLAIRSKADIIFYDDEHMAMIENIIKNGKSNITNSYAIDALGKIKGNLSFYELLEEGRALVSKKSSSYTEYLNRKIDNEKMAALLFTSGTTSQAKGVMLSHKNLATNVYDNSSSEPLLPTDMNMAFLPYHHSFGCMGQFAMLAAGACTAYCDGLKYVQKNLVEYKVSVFFCVPLLIESMYKKIMKEVEAQGKTKVLKIGKSVSKFLLCFGIDIRRKVFKTVLDKLGGNIRFLISGAAALDPVALEGFQSFGILTVQGYGLTETSPSLASESSTAIKLGSVGKAMPSVELKLDSPDEEGVGELLAKADSVMIGYYENEEETKKVFTEDGWFRTGDLATIDKEGFVSLAGRAKNVIVLKNGKNVFPEEIEVALSNLPYISEIMVFGMPKNDMDFTISAKIVYTPDHFGHMEFEEIETKVQADIDVLNDTMPAFKQVRRIILTTEPMIKTTTGKVKRYEELKTILTK